MITGDTSQGQLENQLQTEVLVIPEVILVVTGGWCWSSISCSTKILKTINLEPYSGQYPLH